MNRIDKLAEFQAKYNVQFTREAFTMDEPTADGTFVLTPENDDPLPPVGCKITINGYQGQVWHTVVMDVDEAAGTYMAQIVEDARAHDARTCAGTGVRRSRFGDHTDALYDDGRMWDGESAA